MIMCSIVRFPTPKSANDFENGWPRCLNKLIKKLKDYPPRPAQSSKHRMEMALYICNFSLSQLSGRKRAPC